VLGAALSEGLDLMPTKLAVLIICGFVGFCFVVFFIWAPWMRWLKAKSMDQWTKDFDRKMSIAESGSEFENEIREAKKGN
jgi:hypothetical protein